MPAVDAILEWNAVMIQADAVAHSGGANDQPGPILAQRAMAIASAAMYDAYNSIERIGQRYLVTAPNSSNADSDAAVAQAAHDTLVALYPSQRVAFDAALTQTLRRIPDGSREARGRAVGAFVADAILDARANDGGDSIQTPAYVPNGRPGFHDVDPLHPGQGFYGPDAGDVDPFAVVSTEQFAPGHLGAQGVGSSRTDIAAFLRTEDYERAFDEVKRLGGDGVTTPTLRTAEQTQIGIYWGYDGTPGLGTPPRLYNQIARAVAVQQGNTEAENARMFALVNIAMADAGLTSWEAKYDEEFWRPILGIRGGGEDGNPDTRGDAGWSPLGAPASNPFPGQTNFTPPFPAYTSGHATFGAALFQTLERFYGTSNVPFTFVSDEFNGITRDSRTGLPRTIVARTFSSFDQAKEENGQSRIYLGIHWAFDKTEGIRTGDQVANFVFNNFLRPNTGAGDGQGSTDVMMEWNDIMIQADAVAHSGGANDQPGPILAQRAMAIASAAMYDAYNSIERIGQRYLVTAPNSSNADSDAAVAQAAHDVLVALYPSQRVAFDAALTQTLRRIPDGSREARGRAVGAFVADFFLDARANDGASTIQDPPYVPNGQPGFHDVDPLHPGQGFYAPDAENVTPFAVVSTEQFAPGHLGAQGVGSSRTDIAAFLRTEDYEDAYAEVRRLGGNGTTTPTQRTAEQTEIGIYWGYDGTPGLGTPPRLYNQIARTIAVQRHNTEAENARLFALVNLAMADAGLTAWDAKYDEEFWRPILGIRGGGSDGNPGTQGDPNWSPLGAPASNPFPGQTNFTPPFPAYTSGHATFGAALFQTLERFYGTSNVPFTFVSDEFNGITRDSRTGLPRTIEPRTFTSFDQGAEENGQSRIYLGIHWAFDKTEGIRTGSQVANFVFNNFLRSGSSTAGVAGAVQTSGIVAGSAASTSDSAQATPLAGTGSAGQASATLISASLAAKPEAGRAPAASAAPAAKPADAALAFAPPIWPGAQPVPPDVVIGATLADGDPTGEEADWVFAPSDLIDPHVLAP